MIEHQKILERERQRRPWQRAMTVPDFCQRYRIGRTKTYEEINAGRLKARKSGRRTIIAEEDAEELNRWYEEEHRPEKMALPGYVGMRRFRAFEGAPSFLAIYELTEPEAAVHTAPGPPPSDWMKAVMDKWKHWDRSIWVELMTP